MHQLVNTKLLIGVSGVCSMVAKGQEQEADHIRMIQGQCLLHGTEGNGSPTRRNGMTGLWRGNVCTSARHISQPKVTNCQFHHLWEAGLKRDVLVSSMLISTNYV